MTTVERFEKFIFYSPDGCWYWTGSVRGWQRKYGSFKFNGIMKAAHRVSYIIYIGNIPLDMHVLHSCDNPKCVNPNHLFIGTHQDNMDDRKAKNREAITRGESNGRALLSEKQVLMIRYARRVIRHKDVAKIFKVSLPTIEKIFQKKLWKHI